MHSSRDCRRRALHKQSSMAMQQEHSPTRPQTKGDSKEDPSMLDHNLNTEDIRQEVMHNGPHSVNLYDDIHHSQCLSSQRSTKPDTYYSSARVKFHEGAPPAVPTNTDQVKLYESPVKLYEESILLATTPSHRNTSPQDTSISMTNHSFSPTTTMATLKIHEMV